VKTHGYILVLLLDSRLRENSGRKGSHIKRIFVDVVRPFLTAIPIVKELLALEILWVVRK